MTYLPVSGIRSYFFERADWLIEWDDPPRLACIGSLVLHSITSQQLLDVTNGLSSLRRNISSLRNLDQVSDINTDNLSA
jgi:hypothetical protein